MIKIKVCGMNDPLNVKEIADAGPNFIGFIFYQGSTRYVGEIPEKSLFQNLPKDISTIGVFVNEDADKILNLALLASIGIIQLHGNESHDYCRQLRSTGLKIIKAFSMTENFNFENLKPYMPVCDYFLFDTKTETFGGSGIKFRWDKLTEYNLDKPFFLSGGIGPEDAAAIKTIDNRGFFAVDVNSRFETTPGIKNVSLVKKFIDTIKYDRL